MTVAKALLTRFILTGKPITINGITAVYGDIERLMRDIDGGMDVVTVETEHYIKILTEVTYDTLRD